MRTVTKRTRNTTLSVAAVLLFLYVALLFAKMNQLDAFCPTLLVTSEGRLLQDGRPPDFWTRHAATVRHNLTCP